MNEMTTRVKFCLSCDPLKLDFIAFKMDNMSTRKRIADVVDDYLYASKCYEG